ncbi:MAG: hypothetical protein K2J28_08085 [Duncaniella sp.]|nr:hypothetical protein [Duncaniella sp.]
MKDFLMTSAIPYWLIFIVSLAVTGYCLRIITRKADDELPPISQNLMVTLSGLMILVATAVIMVYSTLGGNALWWITGKEIGYWAKLLRVVPLIIFIVAQMGSPFVYKLFMEEYFDVTDLSVKIQFISLIVIIPVTLLLVYVIGGFFMGKGTQDTVFYIITGTGLIGGIIYSIKQNAGSLGMKAGVIYTATSFLLCASALVSLLYLIVAFFSLIFEMLPVIATIIGICYIFSKSFGNAVMRRDDDGNYVANDGSKHSSDSARNYHEAQIRARRQNN